MGSTYNTLTQNANSTDFVSSICPDIGKKAQKNPFGGSFE